MEQVKVIMNDGSEHVHPLENLPNLQRLVGHSIKNTIILNDGQENFVPKMNRESLEAVAKRELGLHYKTIASLSDSELLDKIKKGK